MSQIIRCNQCMNEQLETESEQVFTCHACETDEYLMVLNYPLIVSVRADLRAQDLEIFVSDGEETYPTTFTNRPARPYGEDSYWVLLDNGEEVIIDSIDLDFESN